MNQHGVCRNWRICLFLNKLAWFGNQIQDGIIFAYDCMRSLCGDKDSR
jgi:hypothetical protein